VKYSPGGEVMWGRTWGGNKIESPRGVAVLSDGNIIVGGTTNSYGAGLDDIYLLKYDAGGNLLMQETWGTSDYERFNGLAVDEQDYIYITGSWLTSGGVNDGLIVKLDVQGLVLWANCWDSGTDDYSIDICVDDEGFAYICGFLEITGKGRDASLLKFSPTGPLEWAKTIGAEGEERFDGVTVQENQILACGFTTSYGDSNGDILLTTFGSDGSINSALTWGGERKQQAYSISANPDYGIAIVGAADAISGSLRGMVLRIESGVITGRMAINDNLRLNRLAFSSNGDLYLVGNSVSSILAWESLDGVSTEPSLASSDLSITVRPIAGEVRDVAGSVSSPAGIIDIDDSVSRVLVVKN
jgi:hypothetical protein